jgi:hypothetical protein
MRTTSILLGLLIPLLPAAARPASEAEPAENFEVLSERCRTLTNLGQYPRALAACERARALTPQPWLQVYIAQLQTALLHPVQAREALEQYLLSKEISQENREMAWAMIRYLDTLLTTLIVTTDVEGAEVLVDDQVVDRSALARGVRVTTGAHRLTLRTQGPTFSRFIYLQRAGERTQIELPGSGTIALNCATPQVRFFVDDQEVSTAQAARGVPTTAGNHRVTIKVGSSPSQGQSVRVNPDERVSFLCAAQPASDDTPAMNSRGFWVTGTGLALGVAALGTAIYNGNQYDKWEAANASLAGTRLPIEQRLQVTQENNELMESIQTTRAVAVGLGIASGLVTAGGIALLFADSREPARNGSSSWFRKVAAGLSVNGAPNSGAIAWRGAW